MGKIFKINGFRDIFSFRYVMVSKFAIHNKIISKTGMIKNQENFAHYFGDKYLTNHLVKSLQDRVKP